MRHYGPRQVPLRSHAPRHRRCHRALVLLALFAGACSPLPPLPPLPPLRWRAPTAGPATQAEAAPEATGPGIERDRILEAGELDLAQVDVAAARFWELHGRLDLTFVHFESSSNVDGFRRNHVLPLNPAVYGRFRLLDRLAAVAEIEYDGLEESVEIDQAVLVYEAIDELLTLRLGRHYFPFGLERLYYSPARNALVDRPAAFRQVYPGTYVDNGLFVEGKYTHHTSWSILYEGGIAQGLRGWQPDDVPNTLEDNNDTPFVGGRVAFAPRPELSVGVSYAIGFWDDRDRAVLDFFGADARLELFEFEVRAEYVGGRVNRTIEYGNFFRQGWYVHVERPLQVDWPWLAAIIPSLRVDWIDSNDEQKDFLDVTRYSGGLGFLLREDLLLKTELSVSDERGRDISNNGFLTQLVFHW